MITLPHLIILASKSHARKTMLQNAGLTFDCVPANIDEDVYKNKDVHPADIAQTLAQKKAELVSVQHPDALVIGADQILEFEGALISKARTLEQAREKLVHMRGKTHTLISSVSIAREGQPLWAHTEKAILTMHDFSDTFLDDYIERAGDALMRSVGAYELESDGAWLFKKIEGDYFTILGMPLLPLLTFLKTYRSAHDG